MAKRKTKYLDRLYFAYGSNLHLEQMSMRCPDSKPVANATLDEYTAMFRSSSNRRGVMDVLPLDGDRVEGALYRVSERDLAELDRYEGYPWLYNRHEVSVRLESGEEVEAFVYRMNDGFQAAVPSEYYFNVILTGYRNWSIDPEHLFKAASLTQEVMREEA